MESQAVKKTIELPQVLSVPTAIIIAGSLIALAVYFSNSSAPLLSDGGAGSVVDNNVAPEAQPNVPSVGTVREVSEDDHVRGASNAKVTVIEYSDLECPFCKRFHPTMQQVLSEYPNDVRWVYRHAPLAQLHSKAGKEAEATECAGEQGKFWELTDKIFEVTPANNGLDLADLPKLAQEAGVENIAKFQSCLDSNKYAQHVADDLIDAQNAGMRGTPYSVVVASNGEKFPLSGAQPYASVKQIIDRALLAK